MPDIIRFEKVSFSYTPQAPLFKELNLSIPQGCFCFITGASGAGKSSLLGLIDMQNKPTQGTVKILGTDVSKVSQRQQANLRRQMGIIFQDFNLLAHLSVFDNVALPLRLQCFKEKDIHQNVRELIKWVGLEKCLSLYPHQISGGQKQRTAIARAVITHPRLLIADEPTGNVDDALAVRLIHLFKELNRTGTTVLIATHSEWLMRSFNYPKIVLKENSVDADYFATPSS